MQFLKITPFHGTSSRAAYRRYIIEPLSSNSQDPCRNLRVLLQGICLRRANQGYLPSDTRYETSVLQMSLVERRFYNTVLEQAKDDMDLRISGLSNVQKYARLFTALSKLRRLCNFGSNGQMSDGELGTSLASAITDSACDLCQREESLDLLREDSFCPVCSRPLKMISNDDFAHSIVEDEYSLSLKPEGNDLGNPLLINPRFYSHAVSPLTMEPRGSTKLATVADELEKSKGSSKRCV